MSKRRRVLARLSEPESQRGVAREWPWWSDSRVVVVDRHGWPGGGWPGDRSRTLPLALRVADGRPLLFHVRDEC